MSSNYNMGAWVIVDGYSSGKHYSRLLRDRGIEVYHVQSMPEILEYDRNSFDESQYARNFVFAGDYSLLLDELKNINISVVLPGCETGVCLADKLSEDLGAPTNKTEKSEARRDKYAMADALHSAGIRAAKTYKVKSQDELNLAVEYLGPPVVIKPCASAGSDGVFICKSLKDIEQSFNNIHLKRNSLGGLNDEVLVQQLLEGKQYIVNTVSFSGRHYAVEIWEDNREDVGSAYIYDYEKLIVNYTSVEANLISYTFEVLDSLGIKNGPCHVELMVKDGVPTLIEVGARPAGGIQHSVMQEAQGYSHVSATVDLFLNPQVADSQTSAPKKHVLAVALISRQSGILKGYSSMDSVTSLLSFKTLTGLPSPGDYISVTRDIETQPGLLMLSHESESQVLGDLQEFRALEKNLFLLE